MRKLIVGLAAVLALSACTASQLRHGEAAASSAIAPISSALNQPSGNATGNNTLEVCAHYSGHVYEVCTAYIVNASLEVLVPYYKEVRSPSAATRQFVDYRLGQRYTGQAKTLIENRVKDWPAGSHEVAVPDIKILSVQSSLTTNTATLHTVETWKVTTQNGKVIYQESGTHHTVTMKRVPSYLLHKWVVSDLR